MSGCQKFDLTFPHKYGIFYSVNLKCTPTRGCLFLLFSGHLDDIEQKLDPLPQFSRLFLHMEIDVRQPEKVLHRFDKIFISC